MTTLTFGLGGTYATTYGAIVAFSGGFFAAQPGDLTLLQVGDCH